MSRDEAEMEYLKIAQDLDMYGVNYFAIKVSILESNWSRDKRYFRFFLISAICFFLCILLRQGT